MVANRNGGTDTTEAGVDRGIPPRFRRQPPLRLCMGLSHGLVPCPLGRASRRFGLAEGEEKVPGLRVEEAKLIIAQVDLQTQRLAWQIIVHSERMGTLDRYTGYRFLAAH